jgi:hypothetical protein
MESERLLQLEQELWRLRDVPRYSQAMLDDADSYVNKNKKLGMVVWDTTNSVPKWASGVGPSDPWITFGGGGGGGGSLEYIVAQDLSDSTFSSTYSNGPSQTFTLDVEADVEYYIEGGAYWYWFDGTANNSPVELEYYLRAQIAAATIWEAQILLRRVPAFNLNMYEQTFISRRFVQKNKAAGTYTVQYQGRCFLNTFDGSIIGKLVKPSVGVVINRV